MTCRKRGDVFGDQIFEQFRKPFGVPEAECAVGRSALLFLFEGGKIRAGKAPGKLVQNRVVEKGGEVHLGRQRAGKPIEICHGVRFGSFRRFEQKMFRPSGPDVLPHGSQSIRQQGEEGRRGGAVREKDLTGNERLGNVSGELFRE